MASELERKDEREFSISVEVGTGALLPGGKIALAFKRAWQHRADRYLSSVADAAQVDEDVIIEAVADGQEFNDAFAIGLQIASQQSDEAYRTTFAHFVVNALTDPAKIDTVSFLMEKFGNLRPPHVKVFWLVCTLILDAEPTEIQQSEEAAYQEAERRRYEKERLRQEEEQRRRERERVRQEEEWRRRKGVRQEVNQARSAGGIVAFNDAVSATANLQINTYDVAPREIHIVNILHERARKLPYSSTLWLSAPIRFASISDTLDLPPGMITTLVKDLCQAGILEETSSGILVTELGRLAYESVDASRVIAVVLDT